MTHPVFSIDLQAELDKLTRRQHLNDVHFLVQLTRHALQSSPREVVIESTRDRLRFTHDGAPIAEREWADLTLLVTRDQSADPELVQDTLTRLETTTGIALLSLVINADELTLVSGGRCLRVRAGSAEATRVDGEQRGFAVDMKRRLRVDLDEEARELRFFCGSIQADLTYNGTTIREEISLERQMLVLDMEASSGRGAVGIPEQDDLCSLTFFKRGVRIGTRRFLPEDGRLYHGWFDSADPAHEANFNATIELGERVMETWADTLYQGVPDCFGDLTSARRRKLEKILLGLDREWWRRGLADLPLFDNAREPWTLTLRDLSVTRKQYGRLPYSPRAGPSLPPSVPVLSPEEIAFFERRMHWPLMLYKGRGVPVTGSPFDSMRLPAPIAAERLDQPRRALLEVLNGIDPMTRFFFADACLFAVDDRGRRRVYLEAGHPLVNDVLDRFHQRPRGVTMYAYRLIGLARSRTHVGRADIPDRSDIEGDRMMGSPR